MDVVSAVTSSVDSSLAFLFWLLWVSIGVLMKQETKNPFVRSSPGTHRITESAWTTENGGLDMDVMKSSREEVRRG